MKELPVELVLTDVGVTDIVPLPSAEYGACNATVCATHGMDEEVVAVSGVAGPVPGWAMSAIVERARLFDVVELTVYSCVIPAPAFWTMVPPFEISAP